jgi:hypothetical protein
VSFWKQYYKLRLLTPLPARRKSFSPFARVLFEVLNMDLTVVFSECRTRYKFFLTMFYVALAHQTHLFYALKFFIDPFYAVYGSASRQ